MSGLLKAVSDELLAWIEGFVRFLPGAIGSAVRKQWLRARGATIGAGGCIAVGARVYHPSGLSVGTNVQINDARINARGGVSIGDNSMVADGARIWSINHGYASTEIPMALQPYRCARVIIEDDVWIAANAVVLPGVTVGRGAIVAAGSVVMRRVPRFAIVSGVPATVVRSRRSEP